MKKSMLLNAYYLDANNPRIINITSEPSKDHPEYTTVRVIFDNDFEVSQDHLTAEGEDLVASVRSLLYYIREDAVGHFEPDWYQIAMDALTHIRKWNESNV